MSNPTIRVHNTETDEVIDREMTDAEFEQFQADQESEVQRLAEITAKASAKETAQAKLAALGLTVEDLQALGL
jgi:uncharacterized protein YfcZ (UPF0381/DUF406 family)